MRAFSNPSTLCNTFSLFMACMNFSARDNVKLNHLKSTLEIPYYVTSTFLCHRSSTSDVCIILLELPFSPLFFRSVHRARYIRVGLFS
jgi:hypothetical protein